MKKIFLSVVISSVLFLIGCKENSTTNPVSSDGINPANKTESNIKTGSIKLDRILELPGFGNTYYQINGIIKYGEELLPKDLGPKTSNSDIKLDISIDAKLINPELPGQENSVMSILEESVNQIYVSQEGIYLLKKTYPVQGTTHRLELVCTYIVTTDGVDLNSMELKIPSNNDK
jgi:hypothetical protein